MDFPRSHEGPPPAPSSHGTQDTQPGSSTADLTEDDLIGVGSGLGWKLDEVMDARQAVAAAAASLQEGLDRNDFLLKPWPPRKLGDVVTLDDVVAQQARISAATSDHPRPRMGTRHQKRKGAEAASGAPEGQPQGLADLADVASMLTPEPSSKRAKTGPLAGMPGTAQAGDAPMGEGAASSKPPVGQKGKKHAPKRQLEELPYRRADGKWTCTFSTGGMNKNRLTLCCRDNEAKRSFCKACRAPRWDWQLRARLAAILQQRDLHTISLQQVMKELNEMSVLNFEGLRFPREAVKHELDAFLACCEHAGKLRQPAEVSSLLVFPTGLRKGCYHAEDCQAAGRTRLQWARKRGDSAEYEVSIEEELATGFRCATPDVSMNSRPAGPPAEGVEAGGSQQEAARSRWQPLCCALVRLTHAALKRQPTQPAGTSPGSQSDAIESFSSAGEATEGCCAFAHSLIEATLRRRWPSRLKLKKSMKGVQERLLRLHLPYPSAPEAEAPAAGACDAARSFEESDVLELVKGVERPLPFSSRAALLQNPPRRPQGSVHGRGWVSLQGWAAPALPRPRIKPSGEPLKPEQPDTSGIEASSWLLAPPCALGQVQHASAPSAVAAPGSSAEPSSSHAAHAEASTDKAVADEAGSTETDKQAPAPDGQRAPAFGQWGSAFRPAVAHAALPAPEVARPEVSQNAPGSAAGAPQKSATVNKGACGEGCPGGKTEWLPEVVNYKTEWKRQLLKKLQQPNVQGLAGMGGLKHQPRLVFQAAAVLGVRRELIESAITRYNALQMGKASKQ